jgi:hypothetical protein
MLIRSTSMRLLMLLACVLLTGCSSPSPWERSYVGRREAEIAAPTSIRDVPWERLSSVRESLQNEVAGSDIHPEDWPEARREAAKSQLLKGLQVSDDPATIEVLGRSEFRTTDDVRPDDGSLAQWAAKIGATRVVWSSKLLGKADRIVEEPVWTYTTGSDWFNGHDHHHGGMQSYSSMTWVPIRVEADEYAFAAFYLRDLR